MVRDGCSLCTSPSVAATRESLTISETCTGHTYSAVKVVDKNTQESVTLEKEIMGLDHPFISRLLFSFEDPQYHYLVTEFYPGGSLFDLIKRKGRLSEKQALFYAAEILLGLEHLHSKGYLHRDLKPENIMIAADGHTKLIDFGHQSTEEYMAPELLGESEGKFSEKSDYWSLGIILF